MSSPRQQGMTLVELIVVFATLSLALAVAIAISVPMIARESMRSAVYDVQTFLQLAKIESVNRNRSCRFEVNLQERRLRVVDGHGNSSSNDDEVLYERFLPSSVVFARPDKATDAVDIDKVNGFTYQTVFDSDGVVSKGSGTVYLHDGDGYQALSIYAAGGLQQAVWGGVDWSVPGSSTTVQNISVDGPVQ